MLSRSKTLQGNIVISSELNVFEAGRDLWGVTSSNALTLQMGKGEAQREAIA